MKITLELVSNSLQFLVGVACAINSGSLAIRHFSQRYAILTFFYITFALGSLYWLVYLLINSYTPKIFYVSDLSWIASLLFMLMLCVTAGSPEEKQYRSTAAWVVTLILIVLSGIILRWGDYLMAILWLGLLILIAFFAVRGWSFAYKQSGLKKDKQLFYGAVLIFVFIDFGLLLASGFFPEISIDTPYIWFDFALSLSLASLLPATIWGLSDDIS